MYPQYQQNLYHIYIDLKKKASDKAWHAALWATMRKYNTNANLVRTTEQLDKATSAVQMNGSIGEWFRTCDNSQSKARMSSVTYPLRYFPRTDHAWCSERTCLKGQHRRQNIINLHFADEIDALAEKEEELEALLENLDKTCTR